MDVFTHFVVGAATGAVWGRPWLGGLCAVLPDAVLGLRRRAAPSLAYRLTHSLVGALTLAGLVGALAGIPAATVALAAAASHLYLDLATHGSQWAPRLLWPWTQYSWGGIEWEFFNESWFIGSFLAFLWMALCLNFYGQ